MAKLYFRYGTVGAGKTLALVNVVQSYRAQGKAVLVMKPVIDTRFGERLIKSRTGLEVTADVLISSVEDLAPQCWGVTVTPHLILVDEAQFLSAEAVDALRRIANDLDVPVICYGLRTDFCTRLFQGSSRLFEVADQLEELKSVCHYCRSKAVFNLRTVGGQAVTAGPVVVLGDLDVYQAVCTSHYFQKVAEGSQLSGGEFRSLPCEAGM